MRKTIVACLRMLILIPTLAMGASAADAFGPCTDQALPGGEGGSLTIHVEAGRRARDFHVTFERAGRGQYVSFDGVNWTAPLPVSGNSKASS